MKNIWICVTLAACLLGGCANKAPQMEPSRPTGFVPIYPRPCDWSIRLNKAGDLEASAWRGITNRDERREQLPNEEAAVTYTFLDGKAGGVYGGNGGTAEAGRWRLNYLYGLWGVHGLQDHERAFFGLGIVGSGLQISVELAEVKAGVSLDGLKDLMSAQANGSFKSGTGSVRLVGMAEPIDIPPELLFTFPLTRDNWEKVTVVATRVKAQLDVNRPLRLTPEIIAVQPRADMPASEIERRSPACTNNTAFPRS